jgi:hypothetical protein
MTETSIKVVKFSRKKQDWIQWQVQHLARAMKKGYRDVLTGIEKIPKKAEEAALDKTKAQDAALLKIAEKNKDVYSDLLLSMSFGTPHGSVAFDIVRQATSADYPESNTANAMARLKKRYQPDTAPELARLHKLFYGTKQKKKQDPDLFIRVVI